MHGLGSDFVNQFVNQTGISESTSSHDFIISSSGTIGVEVFLFNSFITQETGSGGVLGNSSSRGNMISGNGITKVQKAISTFDVFDGVRFGLKSLEERRVMDISGTFFPVKLFVLGHIQSVPSVSSLGNSVVHFGKLFSI